MKLSKKQKLIRKKVLPNTNYKMNDAIALLKEFSSKKFDESIEFIANLGVNSKKSDQVVRGSTNLPRGTGKKVRVAVFAQGEKAEDAKTAGAEIVGFEDLAEAIKSGEINFDILIATPDAMRLVGQLGQILGPRGLMPNPKVGTVTMNIKAAVESAKSGQVMYRTDKNGIIHCLVGKVSFNADALIENVKALLADLQKAKPTSAKGIYLKKITLSSTMGPGLAIDLTSISM